MPEHGPITAATPNTEDGQASQKSLVLNRIEDMQTVYNQADYVRDPALQAHRNMLHAVHFSSNGAPNKIDAIAQSIASIAIVIAQEKLDEPERLQALFNSAHKGVCPVEPLIGRNNDGTPNYPWPSRDEVIGFVKDLRAADAALVEADKVKTRSLGSTFKISKEGISASGAVAYLTLLLAAAGIGLYIWGGHRDKAIEKAVSETVSTQLRAVLNSAGHTDRAADIKASENE